jgi:predicted ferric reductase
VTEQTIAVARDARQPGHRPAGGGGAGARARAANALSAAAGLGLAAVVLLALSTETASGLRARGEPLIALGRVAGMVAAYAMLVVVVLVARVPAIERAVGQDRLVSWHRRLAPWPLYLVAAHGVLITAGYAQQARTGLLHELWTLLTTYQGVLAATAGSALLVAAGVTSYRKARRRMAYETWWAVHLYTYLALFLAFSHQTATGGPFIAHPIAGKVWTALWVGGAALVVLFRIALPAARTLRHRPVVEAVHADAPGVVTLVVRGHALERLPLAGGQFVQLRVLRRGLWWQAHPYSVSGMPRDGRLRLTVKALGDHSAGVARLRPGTRLAIEGPYGVFTKHARHGDKLLLAGAGVGVTPLRALLEDLPAGVDVDVVVRASSPELLVLRDEVRALVRRRGGRLHEVTGSREENVLHDRALRRLVPDIRSRDVYVCGPIGFMDAVASAASAAGVPPDRIHREEFAF